ncbi:MAG: alpha/beta hydrolase [Fimbriimonadaceae bacterium]|nr:alpha/beta hydrolase [Fimbriimonadaceae bacterium]
MMLVPDQVYAEPLGTPLRFDLIRPDSDELLPLAILIHGGGWISGDKSDMRDLTQALGKAGFAVACPQYRLAPLHVFPAAVEDIQAFVRFARTSASEWGLDPNRIASLGNSAGGHLALMSGLTDAPVDGVSSRVNAVVDICGITDVTVEGIRENPISIQFLEQFMGVSYGEDEARWIAASPIKTISNDAPPILIVHGDEDDIVPISQSEALVAELKRCGVDHEYHTFPGEGHSFTYDNWVKIEHTYLDFLRRRLGSAS